MEERVCGGAGVLLNRGQPPPPKNAPKCQWFCALEPVFFVVYVSGDAVCMCVVWMNV